MPLRSVHRVLRSFAGSSSKASRVLAAVPRRPKNTNLPLHDGAQAVVPAAQVHGIVDLHQAQTHRTAARWKLYPTCSSLSSRRPRMVTELSGVAQGAGMLGTYV